MTRIIAGYPGVGKTTMGKMYSNVLDLDGIQFKYVSTGSNNVFDKQTEATKGIGTINPEFPLNYINAIKENIGKYDYILISTGNDSRYNFFKQANIKYEAFVPTVDALAEYRHRYIGRGNTPKFAEMYCDTTTYNQIIKNMNACNVPLTMLKPGETLSEYIEKTPGYPPLIRHKTR